MATLILRLAGPMQSWGTSSRFDERDTLLEPSKSGVIGLVCAALGRQREAPIDDLVAVKMGVRVDKEGILKRDYQTAQNIIAADGKKLHPTAVTNRYYLADAIFLVGLEHRDEALLQGIHTALKNPHWPLSLGRKSYVPSQPIYLADGLLPSPLADALEGYPLLWESSDTRRRFVTESRSGSHIRADQPLAPFIKRRFGQRSVSINIRTVRSGKAL